ncbi:fimbrial biogenesis chaperone [Pseudomonas sp. 44 R 15]|uniref:fimbrial biogenesis chaperone n=1 Tax=Pseudomonas sp. 44 R 15 TaxID=1844105 RepID=UPI000811E24A|nr:molecular chaperone [Pseudomonas sp. 44 R 15]CRM74979.1 Chaperone protein EcpD precursor [Pseudomonas sp. 44 R 15]
MIKLMFYAVLVWACFAMSASSISHAGVMPEQTRLIFHEGQTQRSLMLANTNPYPVVVQTWIDDGEGNRAPENSTSAMIALPSVFRLQPQALQGLRIVYDGSALPKDRESVSWLNLYEIPPAKTDAPALPTRIAVTMNTQMKIFYRPAHLPSQPESMAGSLTFRIEQQAGAWVLVCHNPSPYHASFSSLRVSATGHEYPVAKALDMMTPPLSEKTYPLGHFTDDARASVPVNYTLIDDEGHYLDGHATAYVHRAQ